MVTCRLWVFKDNFIVDISDEKFDDLILFYTYAVIGCIVHNFIENNNDIDLEELLEEFKTTLSMTNPLKASKQSR